MVVFSYRSAELQQLQLQHFLVNHKISGPFFFFKKHLLLPVLCVNYFLASCGTWIDRGKAEKIGSIFLDGSFVQCCASDQRIYDFMAPEIVLDPSPTSICCDISEGGKVFPARSATYYMHVQTLLLFPLSIFAAGRLTSGD